ncbi:hypothetical protein TSUD_171330 [Trifolium subterraneum]|uniref:DUF1664 domain-containing protein n=1 Tax=Trifolium subterraneum TaxID=3900 RepID=A0A2Z6LKK1_TRISU|nr:hypothetical protein TSUD_171330 [Trifolium subterraneum]
MVLPLAKLTILLGAGFVGSAIAKEGRLPDFLPDFSGIVSSGFKVVFRQLQSNGSTPTVTKPHNDALLDQTCYYQLASFRTGWFPDLRFATRRSLNDACTDIGNQLGKVHGSIEDAKRKLSTKVTGVEGIIDRMADDAGKTQADVDAIQHKTEQIGGDLKGFQLLIEILNTKINEIEEKQGPLSMPAIELPPDSPFSNAVQSGPSRLYLEQPSITPISRAESVPPTRSADPLSPSNTVESVQEISPVYERTSSSSRANSMRTPTTGNVINGSSSGGFSGMNLSSMYAPLLRTRSATNAADGVTISGGCLEIICTIRYKYDKASLIRETTEQ